MFGVTAVNLFEEIEDLVGREALPPLRCSVCGRDLLTVFGIALHSVFEDMSLRCYAERGDAPYASGKAYIPLADVVALLRAARAHHAEEPPF